MRLFFIFFLFIITLVLNAQEKYHINSIEIEGNKTTKKSTILRELSFQIGDSLTLKLFSEKVVQSELNISSQWLFNFIDIITTFSENNIDVVIKVVERWYVWPYPILEISERNFNVFWDSLKKSNFTDFSRLNYGVFLNWYNFRGRNELLKIKFRKGYKEHYLFEYDIPYFNTAKTLGTILNFEQFRMGQFHYKTLNNKLLYTSLEDDYLSDWNASISLQYKKNLNTVHRLNIQHTLIKSPEEVLALNTTFLPEGKNCFQYSKLEYHYENENRNSVTYPIKGSFNEVLVEYYNGVNTDFSNFSITAKTERHFTLKPRVYLGNSVKMKFQTNTDLPYVLNESLGFEDYLRGYEYYVLDGEHFAMTKTALKYELIPKTNLQVPYFKMEQFKKTFYSVYFSIFADVGGVIDNQFSNENSLNNSLLASQGVSLDIVTYYDKLIRLEYSRNHLNEWGLYIHFTNPF